MGEPTKTSLDGRVTYDDIDYSCLTAEDMRSAGERVAQAFPGWNVVVTGGPHRFYDVAYKARREARIIELDFYSVRPGLGRLEAVIADIHTRLLIKDETDGDEWIV